MKLFFFPLLILAAFAADGYSQGCNGGRATFNVRERGTLFAPRGNGCSGHTVSYAPRATGCVGSAALVPVTTLEPRQVARVVYDTVQVPVTRFVVAPVTAQAAPAKLPVGPPPVVAYAPAFVETAEPPLHPLFANRPVRTVAATGAGFFRKILDLILPPYRRN